MQANDLDRDTLRRLAQAEAGNGAKAISFYLNLEPTEFATPPARASAIRSLLDEGEKKLKEIEDGHADRALRADFQRARDFFGGELPTDGARGLAVFLSGESDLFEVIRLPRPVQSEVVISDSPFIEPLVDLVSGTWCILLCNRRTGRIFRGSSDRMEEVSRVTSEDVLSQADAGGWSQARYERCQDEEAHRHLKRVADLLHRRFRRAPFDSSARRLTGGAQLGHRADPASGHRQAARRPGVRRRREHDGRRRVRRGAAGDRGARARR